MSSFALWFSWQILIFLLLLLLFCVLKMGNPVSVTEHSFLIWLISITRVLFWKMMMKSLYNCWFKRRPFLDPKMVSSLMLAHTRTKLGSEVLAWIPFNGCLMFVSPFKTLSFFDFFPFILGFLCFCYWFAVFTEKSNVWVPFPYSLSFCGLLW